VVQGARALDAVEQLDGDQWARSERDRHRAIQLDDGGSLVAEQLIVEEDELPPVRGRSLRGLGMDRRDRALDLIRTRPPLAERLLTDRSPDRGQPRPGLLSHR
jgi:hypothetical protein